MGFWDFFWLMVWGFFFVLYLMLLFQLLKDLLQSPDLGGFAKVVWLVGFIVFPFLVALIYIAARGHGMVERRDTELRRAHHVPEPNIAPARSASGASDIASAKKLLDDGTITQEEFERLKTQALI